MRKLTADFILSPQGKLEQGHTLLMEGNVVSGLIAEVPSDAEYYEGVLCPGFINAHCHLELSHLKGLVKKGNKLPAFIKEIIEIRREHAEDADMIFESAQKMDAQMWKNGIQATGDICNTDETFFIKAESNIRYHNFIELFTMVPEKIKSTYLMGRRLMRMAGKLELNSSIVPHAPYSVPAQLFEKIKTAQQKGSRLWSIHLQETDSEDDLFMQHHGALAGLFTSIGVDLNWLEITGKSSLNSIIKHIPVKSNLMFVHNTYTGQNDINLLASQKLISNSWFCFCPNANLFIENELPDIPLFIKNNCNIILGTDSLASNNELSILNEIKTIYKRYNEILPESLLTWATKNGAEYFGYSDLGVFTSGAQPGVICIKGVDNKMVHENALVERIV